MGEDKLLLTYDVIRVEDAQKIVASDSAGGISIFIGTTRDTFEDKTVVRLEYEAYEDMAYKELAKLCKEIRNKWDVIHICIMHRLGVVPLGESSVIIAISSAHRRQCLESVDYCITNLKAYIPIWKKEIYTDGTNQWRENVECTKKEEK